MNGEPTSDHLFEAFAPVPTEDWEDQIRRDLKGAEYAERLLWRTPDGLTLRPYYRSEDLARLAHIDERRAEVRIRSDWRLQQNFRMDKLTSDQTLLRQALEGGVETMGILAEASHLRKDSELAATNFSAILADVPIGEMPIHLDAGLQSRQLFSLLLDHAKGRSLDANELQGSLAYDPLAGLARSGRLAHREIESAAELLSELGSDVSQFRVLRAGTDVYHNGGATIVQETALALAGISEYLVLLIEQGRSAREILDRLYLDVAVSTSFFQEIAKLRALRLLIPQLVEAFLPEESAYELPIHVRTSVRSMTLYDSHTNLLRATTAGASAVIGGCDVLVIHPFDALRGGSDGFGLRLARNIQHLLRHEAYLAEVNDPAGGSYYVEVLTDAIARRAWTEFKRIEEMGGLLAALDAGIVQEQLRNSSGRIESDVAHGRRVLVGTNLYPNPKERLDKEASSASPSPAGHYELLDAAADDKQDVGSGAYVVDAIPAFRESAVIEEARQRTEWHGAIPKILILPIGSVSVRTERARFAANVLASGGFIADVLIGHDTLEAALDAGYAAPDILVLAAADDVYEEEVISQLMRRYPMALIGLVTSDDLTLEVDLVLSPGMDIPEAIDTVRQCLAARRGTERPASDTSAQPKRSE